VSILANLYAGQNETPFSYLSSILYEWILFMQWYGGINNQTISQNNQPDITSSQRFADKVWTPFIGDMPATRDLPRENIRVLGER
jgi:hypothetical protein